MKLKQYPFVAINFGREKQPLELLYSKEKDRVWILTLKFDRDNNVQILATSGPDTIGSMD